MIDEGYIKRMEEWFNFEKGRSSGFDEGEEIEVFNPNTILNDTKLDGYPFPEWMKEVANHFGERVKTEGCDGILLGISYTYMDYYYIIQTPDGKKHYDTCVGHITYLQDKNSENNLDD